MFYQAYAPAGLIAYLISAQSIRQHLTGLRCVKPSALLLMSLPYWF